MNSEQAAKLVDIMERAGAHRRNTYRIYERYKAAIRQLELTPEEYEHAVRRLAVALKI